MEFHIHFQKRTKRQGKSGCRAFFIGIPNYSSEPRTVVLHQLVMERKNLHGSIQNLQSLVILLNQRMNTSFMRTIPTTIAIQYLMTMAMQNVYSVLVVSLRIIMARTGFDVAAVTNGPTQSVQMLDSPIHFFVICVIKL